MPIREGGVHGGLGVGDVAVLLAREGADAGGGGASAEAGAGAVEVPGVGDVAVASQYELGWEQLIAHARELGPDPAFAGVDDRELEVAVHARAVEASVALARLFEVLAEFVVRGIWAEQGCRTPGAWLSWKLGIGASTAREWVRVAIRLRELPQIATRFADGTLSYSKVRALTRIALPDMQDWLLGWADHATAAELEHIARQLRHAQQGRHAAPDADDDPGWDVTVRSLPGGRAEIRLVGAAEEIYELEGRCRRAAERHRAEQAANAARTADEVATVPGSASAEADSDTDTDEVADDADTEQVEHTPVLSGGELGAAMAQAILAGTVDNPPDTSGLDRHTLVLHTPADALARVRFRGGVRPTRAGA